MNKRYLRLALLIMSFETLLISAHTMDFVNISPEIGLPLFWLLLIAAYFIGAIGPETHQNAS